MGKGTWVLFTLNTPAQNESPGRPRFVISREQLGGLDCAADTGGMCKLVTTLRTTSWMSMFISATVETKQISFLAVKHCYKRSPGNPGWPSWSAFSPIFSTSSLFRLVEYVYRRSIIVARVVWINIILNQLFNLFEFIFVLYLDWYFIFDYLFPFLTWYFTTWIFCPQRNAILSIDSP